MAILNAWIFLPAPDAGPSPVRAAAPEHRHLYGVVFTLASCTRGPVLSVQAKMGGGRRLVTKSMDGSQASQISLHVSLCMPSVGPPLARLGSSTSSQETRHLPLDIAAIIMYACFL
jgi:hypothetical protein